MRWKIIIGFVVFLMLQPVGQALPPAGARQGSPDCAALFDLALTDIMAHCFALQPGTVCGGSGAVRIEMDSGQVVEGAGGAARLSGTAAARALDDGQSWSTLLASLPDSFDPQKATTLAVFGPAELSFQTDPGLPAGAAFALTAAGSPLCESLPRPGLLVQAPANTLALLKINGIDVAVNGMAVIHPVTGGGLRVSALTRETILGQTGTVIFAGYGVQIDSAGSTEAVPYDPADVAHLPVEVLPEMLAAPLPGNALVTQEMNLFERPVNEAYTNTLIPAGLPVSVFGRSTDGQWMHIRAYDGAEGWIPAYVLQVNVPGDIPVYDALPPAPIRPFGSIQGYIVTNAENNNLRAGPGENFEIVVTVPLWTELALYGRSPDDEWLLVETQDGQRAWLNRFLVSNSTPYTLDELPYPPGYGG